MKREDIKLPINVGYDDIKDYARDAVLLNHEEPQTWALRQVDRLLADPRIKDVDPKVEATLKIFRDEIVKSIDEPTAPRETDAEIARRDANELVAVLNRALVSPPASAPTAGETRKEHQEPKWMVWPPTKPPEADPREKMRAEVREMLLTTRLDKVEILRKLEEL